MQRGCVSTLAASAKMACERSPESEIEAKSDGDRKLLLVVGVCAELVTEPMSAAQQSKLGNDIGRIMPAPSIAITTFPGCKSSFRKAQDLRKPKPDGGRSGAERLSRPGAGPGHAGSRPSMISIGSVVTPRPRGRQAGTNRTRGLLLSMTKWSTLSRSLWRLAGLMQGGLHALPGSPGVSPLRPVHQARRSLPAFTA